MLLGGLLRQRGLSPDPVRYVDAATLTVIGKALPEQPYNRIDTTRFRVPKDTRLLPPDVTGRRVPHGQPHDPQPAGRHRAKSSDNMAAVAQKGLDLYIRSNGEWVFASRQTEDQRQERPPRRRNNQQYGGGRKGVPASAALRPAAKKLEMARR